MPSQTRLSERRDRYITAVTQSYRDELERILARAQAAAALRLGRELSVDDDGQIELSPGNQAVLRRMDRILLEEVDNAGFPALLTGFVSTFPETLPLFRETFESINETLRTRLPRLELVTRDDERILGSQASSARTVLRNVIERSVATARSNALIQVGAMPLDDLVEQMSQVFRRSIGESKTLAATTVANYYRTIAARSYDRIENTLGPGKELLYQYVGPLDNLTRPFCRGILKANRLYSREEIDRLDNGTRLTNVFISCGAWNCRHSWIVAQIRPKREPLPRAA